MLRPGWRWRPHPDQHHATSRQPGGQRRPPGESSNTIAANCTGNTGAQAGGKGSVLNDVVPEGTIASAACLSLPERWLDIALLHYDKTSLLSWSVANQANNDYFTVERSADGRTFTDLARVAATTASEYDITDPTPLSGYSFYRVKQTDLDGRYRYSPAVSSRREHTEVRLYPSLVLSGEPVQFDLPDALLDGKVTVSLVDQNGRSVRQKTQPMTPTLRLETIELPVGVYLVNLRSDQLNWTGRLVLGR